MIEEIAFSIMKVELLDTLFTSNTTKSWGEFLKYLLLVGVGYGGGNILNYLLARKKTQNDGFAILQEAWTKQFEEMKNGIQDAEKRTALAEGRYQSLFEDVIRLKTNLAALRNKLPDIPMPVWFKDRNGFMMSLNDAYEREFLMPIGKTRSDYLGSKDEFIWGKPIAEVFKQNDRLAKETRRENDVVYEIMVDGIEDDLVREILSKWTFIKYPMYIGDAFVGVGGVAIPKQKGHESLE